MYRKATRKKMVITNPMKAASPALTRAEALMPRRFSSVNNRKKKTVQTGKGTSGTKLMAAVLHQMMQISGFRMQLLAHVSERRPGTGIGPGHAPVADGGEQHGHHGDQDGSDGVAPAAFGE